MAGDLVGGNMSEKASDLGFARRDQLADEHVSALGHNAKRGLHRVCEYEHLSPDDPRRMPHGRSGRPLL